MSVSAKIRRGSEEMWPGELGKRIAGCAERRRSADHWTTVSEAASWAGPNRIGMVGHVGGHEGVRTRVEMTFGQSRSQVKNNLLCGRDSSCIMQYNSRHEAVPVCAGIKWALLRDGTAASGAGVRAIREGHNVLCYRGRRGCAEVTEIARPVIW